MSGLWRYLHWRGRMGRMEYWLVPLVAMPAGLLLVLFAAWITGSDMSEFGSGKNVDVAMPVKALAVAIFALVEWVGITTSIKRLHDRNKAGWWLLASLIPFIGAIWLFIECGFRRGTDGENRFGLDPLT